MHFDLTDLRLMVRVAECNSLTRGAEASFMSLPAASTRIKNLEESVGTKLLYRTSQGVTLTPPRARPTASTSSPASASVRRNGSGVCRKRVSKCAACQPSPEPARAGPRAPVVR